MAERTWMEQGLRDAALSGDAAAWRSLVTSHAESLRRYLAWRLGGRNTGVDDLAQETWLQVARVLHRFAPEKGAFQHWLLGIAFQVLRNHLRSRRRSRQRTMPAAELPDQTAETDQAERVTDALASLPESYEQLLRAKYLESVSVTCLAQRHGQSEKAIESQLTRARQAFRESYQRLLHLAVRWEGEAPAEPQTSP